MAKLAHAFAALSVLTLHSATLALPAQSGSAQHVVLDLPLVKVGLITRGADGHPSWTAIITPNRGLGALYV